MRIVTSAVAVATIGLSALITGAAIFSLGTDRWISSGYFTPRKDMHAEVWGAGHNGNLKAGELRTVVATEAEWLTARTGATTRLHSTTLAGATRIDLGPLVVIDVRPMPASIDIGPRDGEVGGAKLLVSAREPGSGRIVHLIVDAASAVATPRAGTHDGL